MNTNKDQCFACSKFLSEREAEECWCNRCGIGYCQEHYDDLLSGGHKHVKVTEEECGSCCGGWLYDEVFDDAGNEIPEKRKYRKCHDCFGRGYYLKAVA